MSIEAPKMEVETTCQASPLMAENTTISTSPPQAKRAPIKWEMALASSSEAENLFVTAIIYLTVETPAKLGIYAKLARREQDSITLIHFFLNAY